MASLRGTLAEGVGRLEGFVSAPISEEALVRFRRFFVLKTWLWTFLTIGDVRLMLVDLEKGLYALIVTTGTALAWRRRGYWPGVLILLIFWSYKNVYLFYPRTANHNWLEILILATFVLFPQKAAPTGD